MDGLPVLILVALTSAGAYCFGVTRLGLPAGNLRAAIGRVFETLGLTLVFLMLNVGVGVALALAVRTFTGSFFSMYFVDDRFLVLCCIQGLAFQYWRIPAEPQVYRQPDRQGS